MKIRIRTAFGLGSVFALGACGVTVDEGPSARVRVAHLAPDAPAVDFCLAAAGSGEFTGPVLAGAGGRDGLAYTKVTKYLDVPAGAYDVRLVAPGAASCNASLAGLPDFTGLPALADGSATTIAAEGLVAGGAAPFGLRAYSDEGTIPAGKAKLRFIHASPGTPNVDVGLGGGAVFTPVFTDIAFGTAEDHDHGYIATDALSGVEISARATGATTDAVAIRPVDLPAGALVTAFAVGVLGDAQAPLRVLVCNDNQEQGLETVCALTGGAPERARVRIAHWSPDAPAVDICIARSGGAFGLPVLASLGGRLGLSYPEVTAYVDLPIDTYDVRVISATESTCDNPAAPDTNGLAVTKGLTATVAAIGDLERSGAAIADPGFRLAVFADSMDVAANKGKLRFIHASPGTPNVDVGLNSAHLFLRLFGNVEFGKVAQHGGIDMLGYLEADPFANTVVSARVTGSSVDALILPRVNLPAGAIATAVAIGGKTGQAANPLRVLLCVDNAPTGTLFAQCSIAQ
ncbi:MAG: DUF4397 domain-containing protein [Deltaproteobacteria bacterium]|nr:DUF4397 domain-containing protein [Deltaproteobacteria bacterium]